jgi:hypothetical protein
MTYDDDDEAKARNSDPNTSKAAAASMNALLPQTEQEVYDAILSGRDGGATWDEITVWTGMRPGTISPRFTQLVKKGRIFDSGLTRKGDSGRKQTVWIADKFATEAQKLGKVKDLT